MHGCGYSAWYTIGYLGVSNIDDSDLWVEHVAKIQDTHKEDWVHDSKTCN